MRHKKSADAANAGAPKTKNKQANSNTQRRPRIELLDGEPSMMRRPLALIDGRAYAATWLHIKTETSVERCLCIIRGDGTSFCEHELFDQGRWISDLEFEVCLHERPPDDKLCSTSGARAFVKGERPNATALFEQIRDVVDRFIDFDRSLADQRTMSEMVACYIVATWFLDAFNVIGFLWPNGEAGSGKTKLLNVIAGLAYLGQVILAGGSYATLRDLADYGATLCFDDAENLSDKKRIDPDKRALLLAGNRRGSTVTVKEPTSDRKWATRHVNTFCPRCFSATQLPDKVLGSRAIIIPLVRTPDRIKADSDPLDHSIWPHNRRRLIDSLWALALSHLTELSSFEKRAVERAKLSGRLLEPWRAVLAVALWLEEAGLSGLYGRMEKLSVDYQSEHREFGCADDTGLVIRALCKCLGCDVVTLSDDCDVSTETTKTFILSQKIADAAKEIAEDEDLDIPIDSRRVGHIMRKLRFEHDSQGGTHKKGWKVSKQEVCRFARSFGLATNRKYQTSQTSQNVTNVTASDTFDDSDVEFRVEL